MPENRFKYYLRANSLEYYILSGGSVITTPVKTPFNDDPIEWNTIELKWARNSRYHGVMRSFALPATFAGDAANILRHIYYTQGYNGVCYLDVEMRGDTTPAYTLFYTGTIDFFGQYVDNDVSVQVA